MKNQILILGSGSSLGVPRIDGYWGNCDKNNKKNIRTRCSAIITKGNNNILIDTSPDLRQQFLQNKILNVSYVIYTHEHADQTHGINELRAFYFKNKKKIKIFGNKQTIKYLKSSFSYCFYGRKGYKPFLEANTLKKKLILGNGEEKIKFLPIKVKHGSINSTGYIFNKVAYISDCSGISKVTLKKMTNLNTLIIDCLKIEKHPTHFSLNEALKLNEILKPRKTILTNLHSDLDFNFLLKKLPRNVKPAYDGLKINL